MPESNNTKTYQMTLYVLISILVGTYLGLRGATLPNVAKQVNVGVGEIGIIITSGSAGLLLANILAASIFDHLKGHKIFSFSALLMIIGVALIPVMTTVTTLVILTFFIGAIGGLLLMGINTLPLWIYGEQSGTAMNAIQFASGIGQFLGPLLVSLTLPINGTVSWAFWICAIGFALVVPLSFFVKSPPIRQVRVDTKGDKNSSTLTPKERKIILLLTLFLMVYLGGEVSFGSWITTFAQSQLPIKEINKSYTLASVFWGFMIIGRLLATFISTRLRSSKLLSFDMVGILFSLMVIVLSSGNWSILVIGTSLLGITMASVFASVFTYAEELMPVTGKLSSMLMMGASIGAIVFPMLLGKILANSQPMNIMIALSVMMAVSAGIFFYLKSTTSEALQSKVL